ncbi:MAG TPA: hypothetical protein QF353_02630 [Gammaproteobacteria bacterium]|nr:hypothetical protein [Gammaproteobacteria bacterium]
MKNWFINGCYLKNDCRQQLNFGLTFKTASLDLNNNGHKEVIVNLEGIYLCGSGGCRPYILAKRKDQWKVIGSFFPGHSVEISSKKHQGYHDIYFKGRWGRHSCVFHKNRYECEEG